MAEAEETAHLAKHESQETGVAQGMEKKKAISDVLENVESETAQPVYQVRPHMYEK